MIVKKIKIHNERNAGRKPKYGEETKMINTRVPLSKVAEFKKMVRDWLLKFEEQKSPKK